MTMTNHSIKTHSELIKLPTFLERFRYLKLDGTVGMDTFGHDRFINQELYTSMKWRRFRRDIIIRDNGCDLAHEDYLLDKWIIIHHLNPLSKEDILRLDPKIFDPENVVCTCRMTHNAIHYGDEHLLMTEPIKRTPFDTCPWRKV